MAKGESGGAASRGLETHSVPHAGLLMTSDVACARPLSPGSGEGQPIQERVCAAGRERASHQTRSLPDLWLLIAAHGALRRTRGHDRWRARSRWLELGVWLTRSLPRYAARNFSIEKTVPRDSM